MATSYTSLLGLALPVTGELQGTWGTTVNDEITSLLDSAVAGTTTISADSDVVLTTTTGAANQARQAIILWTANGTATRNITAPAQSKAYVVINASAGTQSIVIRGAGPTTGVTVAKGERVLVAWNGSDFVRIAAYGGTGEFTTVDTTNIEVTNIKAKDGTASASIADSTGVMSLVSNPVLSAGTANGVVYLNGSKVATSGSALTFDGNALTLGGATPRLLANMSGAPQSSRFGIQNSTTNGNTRFFLYPNGTGTISAINGTNNSNPDAADFQAFDLAVIGTTDVRLSSSATGAAAFLPLTFYTNGSEQMRLTSTGLGIGTSSPGAKLDVQGSATDFVAFNGLNTNNNASVATSSAIKFGFTSTVGTHYATFKITEDTGNDNSGGLTIALPFGGTESTKLTLSSSGNLGLGVTPSAWGAVWKAQQLQAGAFIASQTNANDIIHIGTNAFANSSNAWTYINTAAATRYQQYLGAHSWYTAPSGTAGNAITFTQAMTLDASGNLQLGVTSGSGNRLNVVGTGGIRVNEDGSSTKVITVRSDFAGVDPAVLVSTNHALLFGTNNTERARITSGGAFLVAQNAVTTSENLGVTYTGNNDGVYVYNVSASPTGTGITVNLGSSTGTNVNTAFLYRGRSAGGDRFYVYGNGGIANYQGNDVNLSDRREKTNFAPAKSYLDTICAIPVQTFEYIDQSPDDPGLTLGVVAQDVQAVAPELVMESNWGTADNPKMRLSIYQTDLQYALMKCVQELKAELDATKARLAALEAQP